MLFAVNVLGGGDPQRWYLAFPVLGAITLLSALWLLFTPIPRERVEATGSGAVGRTFALLSNRTVLLLFLGIFFVVGIDVGTNFVSSKILHARFAWSLQEAGVAPQVYFVCRTVGAFLGVFIMTRVAAIVYFRWNMLLCIASILVLAFYEDSPAVSLVCIGAIGFLCSCVFSIIYSMALQAVPDKTNLISGLMITAVAGGGAVTPIIGGATDMAGITAGVCVLLLCAFYLTFCAFGVRVKA